MIKVNVFADNKNRKHKIKNPSLYIKKKIQRLKKYYFFKNKNIEFSILLTGNEVIKKLNKRFRNKNKITDVLSFPFFEQNTLKKMIRARNNIYLGDVVINLNKINSGPTNDILLEFDKIWIHGMLHLFGYKHYTNIDYKKMNNLEKKIINYLENEF